MRQSSEAPRDAQTAKETQKVQLSASSSTYPGRLLARSSVQAASNEEKQLWERRKRQKRGENWPPRENHRPRE